MTEYENLIAGPFPLQKDTVTIGGNQTLKAGCVLGFKSVSAGAKGKYRFALSSITAAAGTVSVTIGENTIIGAGSVVTHDIPANVIAVGNPCRVLREISEEDKKQHGPFHDKK